MRQTLATFSGLVPERVTAQDGGVGRWERGGRGATEGWGEMGKSVTCRAPSGPVSSS